MVVCAAVCNGRPSKIGIYPGPGLLKDQLTNFIEIVQMSCICWCNRLGPMQHRTRHFQDWFHILYIIASLVPRPPHERGLGTRLYYYYYRRRREVSYNIICCTQPSFIHTPLYRTFVSRLAPDGTAHSMAGLYRSTRRFVRNQ